MGRDSELQSVETVKFRKKNIKVKSISWLLPAFTETSPFRSTNLTAIKLFTLNIVSC